MVIRSSAHSKSHRHQSVWLGLQRLSHFFHSPFKPLGITLQHHIRATSSFVSNFYNKHHKWRLSFVSTHLTAYRLHQVGERAKPAQALWKRYFLPVDGVLPKRTPRSQPCLPEGGRAFQNNPQQAMPVSQPVGVVWRYGKIVHLEGLLKSLLEACNSLITVAVVSLPACRLV